MNRKRRSFQTLEGPRNTGTLIVGLLLCCTALLPTPGFCAAYQVKQDGSGDFTAIQAAMDAAADGDVIVVHPGIYYENIHFDGKNITLRSLDPEDEVIVASTIIDGGQNGSVVTFVGSEDETCLLSGFTITNGKAENGGGISGGPYPNFTRAAISNCTISGNSAVCEGGGLAYYDGPISDCMIIGNSAGWFGGGLSSCGATMSKCTISGNSAVYDGGGLALCGGSMSKCTISGNSAVYDGGGLGYCHGAISHCTISGNSGGDYGGGLNGYDGTISHCTITGNSAGYYGGGLCAFYGTISNCTISGNFAGCGAGLYDCDGPIRNCTITANSADYGGGLAFCYGMISNCIVWRNQAAREGNQLYGCESAVITYSCVQDWAGGGEGNISDDPLFVSGPLGDYYLSCREAGQAETSACVDAGSKSAYDAGLANVTTRTDGRPDTGVVDIGCHYPTLFALPEVRVSTDRDTYRDGDTVQVRFEAVNLNEYSYPVDIYAGIITPDGAIWTIDASWVWSASLNPWFASLTLPRNLTYGPTTLLTIPVPSELPLISAPGTYWAAAVFACVGTMAFIGEPSLFQFTITG